MTIDHLIVNYMPWFLSALTIYMTILAGNKHPQAWLVALMGQAMWLLWILKAEAYGFLPMNLALWIVYARNHWKWREAVA